MKLKICPNCQGQFRPNAGAQIFCSKGCRQGWQYRKQRIKRKRKEEEEAAEQMAVWHERERLELKKSVCLYCLRFEWKKEPTMYCSIGCKVLHEGH